MQYIYVHIHICASAVSYVSLQYIEQFISIEYVLYSLLILALSVIFTGTNPSFVRCLYFWPDLKTWNLRFWYPSCVSVTLMAEKWSKYERNFSYRRKKESFRCRALWKNPCNMQSLFWISSMLTITALQNWYWWGKPG